MGSTTQFDDGPVEPDHVTQVVIVGTGPAGGSLAAFLGSHGQFETVTPIMCRMVRSDDQSDRHPGNTYWDDFYHV